MSLWECLKEILALILLKWAIAIMPTYMTSTVTKNLLIGLKEYNRTAPDWNKKII